MGERDVGAILRLLVCAIWVLIAPTAGLAETEGDPEEIRDPNAEGQSLHELENQALLERFRAELEREIRAKRAQLREVAESEILFRRARDAREAITLPDPGKADEGLSEVETARLRLAEAEGLLSTLKRKQASAKKEKGLLADYIADIDAVLSELRAFDARAEALQAYVRQIELRVADGSLARDEVPQDLRGERLASFRDELRREGARLEIESEEAQGTMEAMSGVMDEIAAALREAGAQKSSAQERMSQAERRGELADTYSGWSETRLLAELEEQERERKWLQATLENSRDAFVEAREAKAEMERRLAELDDRAEDGETGSADGGSAGSDEPGSIAERARERLQRIDESLGRARELAEAAGVLEADARVLVEHLFPMLVIAKVLEDSAGERGAEALARLDAVDERLSALISDAQAALAGAEAWKEALEGDRAATEKALDEAEDRLEEARKLAEMDRQTEAWAGELKEMSAQEVEARFEEVFADWEQKKGLMQTRSEAYHAASAEAGVLREEIASLKGPFEREEETAGAALEQEILLGLFRAANLEIPEDMKEDPEQAPSAGAAGDASDGAHTQAQDAQPAPGGEEAAEPPGVSEQIARVEAYQHLITTRLRIVGERDRLRGELAARLQTLLGSLEELLAALNDGYAQSLLRLVAAGEFKKRVGRGEIASAKHPKKIIESLKRAPVARLSEEKERLLDARSRVQGELTALEEAQKEGAEEKRAFSGVDELVGRRLDELRKIGALAESFDFDVAELSEVERKKLERAAIQRMEAENTWEEALMEVFHASENIQTLAEMLHDYYLELSELHRKQENLRERRAHAEEVIGQYQAEKEALAALTEALEKRREDAIRRREAHKLLTRVRLNPEQANESLEAFEAQYGYRPPTPAPLPEEALADDLREAARMEFAREMEVRGIDRWLDLVADRRSAQGLDRLIGGYQEMIAGLDSQLDAVGRRVDLIYRGPSSEIAVLRDQRLKLYRETMTVVVVKLAAILVLAFVALAALRVSTRRWARRAERRLEDGTSDDTSMISIINLLSLVLRLMVWGVAFLMALSALGFDIAAILAGIGIGGFALAMAAKGFLSDIIGGVTIMLTRLFQVGDRIEFKDSLYIVKAINVRYTILEDFSYNYKVTVPNSMLAESEVINTSAHPGYTVLTNIRLSINNPAKRILKALQIIEEVIQSNPGARFIWVKHDHFDDYSFVIRMHYDVLRFKERAQVETDINAGIVERFQQDSIKLTTLPGLTVVKKTD